MDIITILVKRRWLIIGITGVAAILTFALLLYSAKAPSDAAWNPLPNIYMPTVKVLISSQGQSSAVSSILSQSGLGQLSGLLGAGSTESGGGNASALAKNLLMKANLIADTVSEEFEFVTRYELKLNSRTSIRDRIRSSLNLTFDTESGFLEVGYRDRDPVFATAVVNRIVELLDQQFKQLTFNQVDKKVQYLQEIVKGAEEQSNALTEELVTFQKKYGIIDTTGTSSMRTETLTQIEALKTQLFNKQVELDLQKEYYPDSDSRIVRLKADIAQLGELIAKLSSGSSDLSSSPMQLNQLPEIAVRYMTLRRDAAVSQTVLTTLKQQYEAAKLQVTDNSSTLQIVEKAEVPEMKEGPARSKIAIIVVAVAFLISLLTAFIAEYFSRARRDEIDGAKLAVIRNMFSFRKRARKV